VDWKPVPNGLKDFFIKVKMARQNEENGFCNDLPNKKNCQFIALGGICCSEEECGYRVFI